MAVAAVDNKDDECTMFDTARDPTTSAWTLTSSRDGTAQDMISHCLDVAPDCLAGFFGQSRPAAWVSASDKVLASSSSSRLSLFGCKWVMKWPDYRTAIESLLDLPPDTDVEAFTQYMVSVGAFVTYTPAASDPAVARYLRGVSAFTPVDDTLVVLDPSLLAACLAAVMNHRYVGAKTHDPDSTAILSDPDHDDYNTLFREKLLMGRVVLDAAGTTLTDPEQLEEIIDALDFEDMPPEEEEPLDPDLQSSLLDGLRAMLDTAIAQFYVRYGIGER